MSTLQFIIDDPSQQDRIDKALNALCPDLSRTRIKALIDDGHVLLNGEVCGTSLADTMNLPCGAASELRT